MKLLIETDYKCLVSIKISSGLPLTKDGVPFTPIRFLNSSFNYFLNNIASRWIIPEVSIINDADYTQPDRRLILYNNIINWPPLNFALEII